MEKYKTPSFTLDLAEKDVMKVNYLILEHSEEASVDSCYSPSNARRPQ